MTTKYKIINFLLPLLLTAATSTTAANVVVDVIPVTMTTVADVQLSVLGDSLCLFRFLSPDQVYRGIKSLFI